MNKNKFRFWSFQEKAFVQHYKYNNFVDEKEEQDALTPQQFLGIFDSNMKEVYEGDVVKFIFSSKHSNAHKLGVITYMADYCAYVIHYEDGYIPIMNIDLDSLEIVGNIIKDYMWDEEGTLIKNETSNS